MDLITLLAENEGIGKDEIEKIWTLVEEQQMSMKIIIFNCLLEISPNLSSETYSYLIENKLEQIQDSDFDEPTLNFILKLSQQALKLHLPSQAQKKTKFGLGLFWKLIQNSSKSSTETKDLAMKSLLKVAFLFF